LIFGRFCGIFSFHDRTVSNSPKMTELAEAIRQAEVPMFKQAVIEATDKILASLVADSKLAVKGRPLGDACFALAKVVGIEEAHAFAQKADDSINLRPDESFDMWLDLFSAGIKMHFLKPASQWSC